MDVASWYNPIPTNQTPHPSALPNHSLTAVNLSISPHYGQKHSQPHPHPA